MKTIFRVGVVAFAFFKSTVLFAADPPPPWAYGFADPMPPQPATPAQGGGGGRGRGGAAPDPTLLHVPGSTLSFTRAQIVNQFGPADWFPGDHPTMPEIVAHGKMPDVRACAICHYPNGKGRAENAGVSGFRVSYFIQQMHDFRDGNRRTSDWRKTSTDNMVQYAKGMTEDEIKAAAEYFGAMKWTPWITVEETATVPKTRINGGLFLKAEGNDREPIGDRIIEVPVDTEATEILRNPHSPFTAYVPPGSLKKGEALVTNGAGKTIQCGNCHGSDLRGEGPVPGIAGRSPSYMVRQMYDMQSGARKGEWTELMKPVVEKLSNEDMLDIAAYTASRQP